MLSDEYKEAFLEDVAKLCGAAATTFKVASKEEDLQVFLERLEHLNLRAKKEGLEEEILFNILSYSPDDELEES